MMARTKAGREQYRHQPLICAECQSEFDGYGDYITGSIPMKWAKFVPWEAADRFGTNGYEHGTCGDCQDVLNALYSGRYGTAAYEYELMEIEYYER